MAYAEWGSKSEFEQTSFKEIEGLVEVMTVVPALLDHRQLRVYQRQVDTKGFANSFSSVELTASTHAIETGHSSLPLIALTDEGPAVVGLTAPLGGDPLQLALLELNFESVSRFSESDAFNSDLQFLHDLDNDGIVDMVLPTLSGWSIYQGLDSGFTKKSQTNLLDPREVLQSTKADAAAAEAATSDDDDDFSERQLRLMPAFQDINGDHLVDLVLFDKSSGSGPFIFVNQGTFLFSKPTEINIDRAGPTMQIWCRPSALSTAGRAS